MVGGGTEGESLKMAGRSTGKLVALLLYLYVAASACSSPGSRRVD